MLLYLTSSANVGDIIATFNLNELLRAAADVLRDIQLFQTILTNIPNDFEINDNVNGDIPGNNNGGIYDENRREIERLRRIERMNEIAAVRNEDEDIEEGILAWLKRTVLGGGAKLLFPVLHILTNFEVAYTILKAIDIVERCGQNNRRSIERLNQGLQRLEGGLQQATYADVNRFLAIGAKLMTDLKLTWDIMGNIDSTECSRQAVNLSQFTMIKTIGQGAFGKVKR
ncbi:hypothetical protein HPULCUR_001911 [Helicostylum pulchrum]|uniref:Uncharacterized protein n=1 Tax=Helicostylum pulchrum TaxID=562976 RepID=A0ABP9XP09_9FUNG